MLYLPLPDMDDLVPGRPCECRLYAAVLHRCFEDLTVATLEQHERRASIAWFFDSAEVLNPPVTFKMCIESLSLSSTQINYLLAKANEAKEKYSVIFLEVSKTIRTKTYIPDYFKTRDPNSKFTSAQKRALQRYNREAFRVKRLGARICGTKKRSQ